MILALESDFEVLAMDENAYEDQMLLTGYTIEDTKESNNCSYSTALTEGSSFQMEGDMDFLGADQADEVTPSKVASSASVKKEHGQSPREENEEKERTKSGDAEVDQAGDGVPGELDVLCGQSRICAAHTGNKRFQAVLDVYAPKYSAVTSKQEKMTLTKEIVACIQESGGRFLRYKGGKWREISTVIARDKVSHALRTKVASWKRQQEEEKSESSTPGPKGKRTSRSGRRTTGSHRRRGSSSSSLATCPSDIVTNSFDSSDPTSNSLVEDLLKTQREIFANLQKDCKSSAKDSHPLRSSKNR